MTKKNPKYNGLHVFKPNLNALRCGDVFLTRNAETTSKRDKLISDVIAMATRGHFSHALMCTAPPTLIEAIGDGVSNITVQICFAHDLKNVRVLRYRDNAIASAAASAAMRFFAKGYSVRAAVASIRPGSMASASDNEGIFCSALVAAAFRAGGAPEFASTNPMKVTPAKLEKSDAFTDVTTEVFVSILSPSNIEDMSALDGDRRLSPFAGQAQLLNSYYTRLSGPIGELIARHPAFASHRPTSFFECVQFIPSLCAAAKRFPQGTEEDWVRGQARLIDDFAYAFLSEGKLQAMSDAARVIDEESSRYLVEQSFRTDPDIDLDDIVGLIKATRAQIASRASVMNDPERPPGLSRTWDEWIRITEGTLEDLHRRLSVLNEVLARAFPSAGLQN